MRGIARVLAVLIVTLVSVGPVSAASPSAAQAGVTVDLEGQPINPTLTSKYHCYDADYPAIHCWKSASARDAALAARATSGLRALSASDYVVIYDGPNFSGASMVVSQNYDVLFTIGWNDRISSYTGLNSASGSFWTDWFASGTLRSFCCNTHVSSLPSNLDNAFSSVYRN